MISGDWVADRSFDVRRLLPEGTMLFAAALILRYRVLRSLGRLMAWLSFVPLLLLASYGPGVRAQSEAFDAVTALNASAQTCVAALVFYVAIALGTGLKAYFAVPALAVLGLLGEWAARLLTKVPFFRTIVAAGMGFALLVLGMFVSLYRERFLARIGGKQDESVVDEPGT